MERFEGEAESAAGTERLGAVAEGTIALRAALPIDSVVGVLLFIALLAVVTAEVVGVTLLLLWLVLIRLLAFAGTKRREGKELAELEAAIPAADASAPCESSEWMRLEKTPFVGPVKRRRLSRVYLEHSKFWQLNYAYTCFVLICSVLCVLYVLYRHSGRSTYNE